MKASTDTITGQTEVISHGDWAIARRFWVSCSITPQLMAGGRRPSPRKLRPVSARIIPGMARVAVAMMWLLMAGTMWRRMTRFLVAPSTSEAST